MQEVEDGMGWWEEAEGRAHRYQGPYSMVHALRRKLAVLQPDPVYTAVPALTFAQLFGFGCDLVQWVDSLLVAPAGDRAALCANLLELGAWCPVVAAAIGNSEGDFLRLITSLALDDTELANHLFCDWPPDESTADSDRLGAQKTRPLYPLFERIDLRLDAGGLGPALRQPLAWRISEVYAACLRLNAALARLTSDRRVPAREIAALVVGVHAQFHLHVGPRQLAPAGPAAGGGGNPGLPACIGLCLRSLGGSCSAPEALSGSS